MIELVVSAIILIGAYFIGGSIEKKHFKSIRKREKFYLNKIKALTTHELVQGLEEQVQETHMVSTSVVIGQDRFKLLFANLINIFGGRVKSFETLLDRARREAMLRLMKKASKINANYLLNVRLENSQVSSGKKTAGSIEVYAYATALTLKKQE